MAKCSTFCLLRWRSAMGPPSRKKRRSQTMADMIAKISERSSGTSGMIEGICRKIAESFIKTIETFEPTVMMKGICATTGSNSNMMSNREPMPGNSNRIDNTCGTTGKIYVEISRIFESIDRSSEQPDTTFTRIGAI